MPFVQQLGRFIYEAIPSKATLGSRTKFCTNCQAALHGGYVMDPLTHHKTFTSFFTAIESGCYFCSELLSILSHSQRRELLENGSTFPLEGKTFTSVLVFARDNNGYASSLQSAPLVGCFRLQIQFNRWITRRLQDIGRETNSATDHVYLWVELQLTKTLDVGMLGQVQSTRTDSRESFAIARQWIAKCVERHSTCNYPVVGEYPSRLLEITDRNGAFPNVRLLVSAEGNVHGSYATLSHCWGKQKILTLLKANIQQFREHVPWESLTKTFQEAITITNKLNIRYIWIDSLCILQDKDDMSDWLAEAPCMEKYYGNAFINIAATASQDGSQGLFRERDIESVRHRSIRLAATKSNSLERGHLAGEYLITNSSRWDSNLDSAILNTRAWVLQERLLARRILHFGADQLFWECCEHTASEMYPSGLPQSDLLLERNLFKDVNPASQWNRRRYKNVPEQHIPYVLWERVKMKYASSNLTVTTDKTIAIMGVANHFVRATNDEYVVGMWRSQLPHQLLWHIFHGFYPPSHELTKDPRQFPVPSWSWMSVNCPVADGVKLWYEKAMKCDILIEVLEIEVNDPLRSFARSTDTSFIRLKGILSKCDVELDPDGRFYVYGDWESERMTFFGPDEVYLDRRQDDIRVAWDRKSCYFLPIRLSQSQTRNQWAGYGGDLEGLMLESIKGSQRYRRLGYISVVRKDQVDGFTSRQLCDESELSSAPEQKKWVYGPKQTIEIV